MDELAGLRARIKQCNARIAQLESEPDEAMMIAEACEFADDIVGNSDRYKRGLVIDSFRAGWEARKPADTP